MPSKKKERATPAQRSTGMVAWLRRRWLVLAGVVVAVVAAGAWTWAPQAEATAAGAPAPAAAGAAPAWLDSTPGGLPMPATAPRTRELVQQLELADHTLCSYRESTKYPIASRPIGENSDQAYPNQPVSESNALRKEDGGSDPNIQVQTSQTRVFMASGESVSFAIKASDSSHKPLPIVATRAQARGLAFGGARAGAQVPLQFGDSGSNGDVVAGDGTYSGTLSPAQTGLASFDGTIRTEIKYSVNGSAGVVFFDVIYTPELPATWGGQIRETTENGSLTFYLKAEIRSPGRYIVNGRVDDAKGKPFALATFNDVLAAGTQEIRLTVFGKLLRDEQPAFPLTLRDVDGYLLKENTDPDRALMPRLAGTAHVSKNYALKGFSDAEWQGEERTRYLTELSKDVELAKGRLLAGAPEMANGPLPLSDCSKQAALKPRQ